MLVSHRKRFIYLKTRKTASTSTEIFLEPYCVDDPSHVPQHSTRQLISDAGIVGSRREGVSAGDLFFNHMPAALVRERIGVQNFDDYLTICNVRNPYDKMVSRFWWRLSGRGTRNDYTSLSFGDIRGQFNDYIMRSDTALLDNDRSSYFIEGPVVDQFIRFEHLSDDMARVCSLLNIDYDRSWLGRYNSGIRHIAAPTSAFYDAESAAKVARIFAWDIEKFGYRL